MIRRIGTTSLKNHIIAMAALTKLPIGAMITMSAVTGYLCTGAGTGADLGFLIAGVFFLGAASAVLNQVQDAKIDKTMARTASRPIPSGRISMKAASVIAALFFILGCASIMNIYQSTYSILALGITAIVWYNGIYFALKRLTAFAAVPGAVIGAIPPAMGWLAGGGDLTHPLCLSLCTFIFLWQIPHFWLLALYRADEYQHAGLPAVSVIFSRSQLRRITAIWILAVATGGMVFPLLMRFDSLEIARWTMIVVSMGLAILAFLFFLDRETSNAQIRRAFGAMNGYIATMLLALSLAAF